MVAFIVTSLRQVLLLWQKQKWLQGYLEFIEPRGIKKSGVNGFKQSLLRLLLQSQSCWWKPWYSCFNMSMGCFWWLLLPEGLFGWLLERWPFYLGQQGKPQRLVVKKSNCLSPVYLLIHRKNEHQKEGKLILQLQELMVDPELSNASYMLETVGPPPLSAWAASFRKHSYSSSIAGGGNCVCWTLCMHYFIPFSQLPSQVHLVSMWKRLITPAVADRVWCGVLWVLLEATQL